MVPVERGGLLKPIRLLGHCVSHVPFHGFDVSASCVIFNNMPVLAVLANPEALVSGRYCFAQSLATA